MRTNNIILKLYHQYSPTLLLSQRNDTNPPFPIQRRPGYIIEPYIFRMQSQTIDLSQILQVLSLHNKRSSTVSYQISDDLQSHPKNHRPESEADQITFELLHEDSDPINQKMFRNPLKSRDQCSHGKLPSMFQLFKQDPTEHSHHQPAQNAKIFTEKKKSSRQTVLQLKRKILDQRKNDEFCRKYTELFDSIFFQKEGEKEKCIQDEKELSMLSTTNELLSTCRSIEENPCSSTSIIHSIAHPKITSNVSMPVPPKVVITYEPQTTQNNTKTLCEGENAARNGTIKARISFTYGQPQKMDLRKSFCSDGLQCF